MEYYVYILSNKTNTTIYTGVSNNIMRRVYEHRENLNKRSFTARYNVHKLVYYEIYKEVEYAIAREKQIKSWSRARKNELVASVNPEWKDLFPEILG